MYRIDKSHANNFSQQFSEICVVINSLMKLFVEKTLPQEDVAVSSAKC